MRKLGSSALNGKPVLGRLLILLACASLGGCIPHLKEVDSYGSEFRDTWTYPESVNPPPQSGDPYSFGGVAGGSGGLIPRQSYATDDETPDPRDLTFTGKMGEIGKDRTPTPGALPGETATLPGASAFDLVPREPTAKFSKPETPLVPDSGRLAQPSGVGKTNPPKGTAAANSKGAASGGH